MFSILYRFLKQFSPITYFLQKNVKHVFLFFFFEKTCQPPDIEIVDDEDITHTPFLDALQRGFCPPKTLPSLHLLGVPSVSISRASEAVVLNLF